MDEEIVIRLLEPGEKTWVSSVLTNLFGSSRLVTKGKTYEGTEQPGFVAVQNNRNVGIVLYTKIEEEIEILTINSLHPGKGIGTKLLDAIKEKAKSEGVKKLTVITTNDNTNAMHFYQKRGFVFTALYVNALEKSRQLKPEIPEIGIDGIALRDELELEYKL